MDREKVSLAISSPLCDWHEIFADFCSEVQGRFKHHFLPENRHLIDEIQAEVDKNWEELKKKCNR